MSTYLRITMLFAVLTGLLMLLGYAVGLFFGSPLLFMLLGLALAGVMNFVTYFYSDTIVIKMSRARIIQESDNPTLYGVVRDVAQRANIPMPRVGIVNSQQPNAFATGRGPQKSVVVATSGILMTLQRDELQAVIGHEVGHVVHRDVLMSSVAATIAGVISYLGNMALWTMMLGGGNQNNRQGGSLIPVILAVVLVPLGATFVQLGISRAAEYNADDYGAKLTRNPAGLASALLKITAKANAKTFSRSMGSPSNPSPATASLWIVNPFKGHGLAELFSTHPATQKRVERLRAIGREMGVYVP